MTDPIAKLLPCPWCGATDEDLDIVIDQSVYSDGRKISESCHIECKCGAHLEDGFGLTAAEITKKWNARALPPVAHGQGVANLIAAVKRYLEADGSESSQEMYDALHALPAPPAPAVGWIACETQLPQNKQPVFFCRGGEVVVGNYSLEPHPHFNFHGHLYWIETGGVTHWLPLAIPAPPATNKGIP